MKEKMKDKPRPAAERLWGGGFSEPLDPVIERFCGSFAFDRRLLRADVAVNRAWVAGLWDAGVLSAEEAARLDAALRDVGETPIPAFAAGDREGSDGYAANGPRGDGPAPKGPGEEAPTPEDVHTYVEMALASRVGAELAGKLRTGRSRNDLVATDLRIFCREGITATRQALAACVAEFASLAERAGTLTVPGYTHLRRAQPILLAHQVLAHAERLIRDDGRLAEAAVRLDACPLGSGALAGTTLRVDRQALARRLGFSRPTTNSLGSVCDRDFVADTLYACSLAMIHLSQISEDLILGTAEEFGWLALSDAAATGSSLMPQKKNPDVLELIRGKAGRVAGRLSGFLTTLKGLPSAYNRDLQEDKEALFDTLDTTRASLEALAVALHGLKVMPERGLSDDGGDLLATDLADYLTARGLPFARAHRLAGEAAATARAAGVPLPRLPLAALRQVTPLFEPDVFQWLDVRAAVSRRACEGGTAPERVATALRRVRSWAEERMPDLTTRRVPGVESGKVESDVRH
jgi:argininosuccinate lyase